MKGGMHYARQDSLLRRKTQNGDGTIRENTNLSIQGQSAQLPILGLLGTISAEVSGRLKSTRWRFPREPEATRGNNSAMSGGWKSMGRARLLPSLETQWFGRSLPLPNNQEKPRMLEASCYQFLAYGLVDLITTRSVTACRFNGTTDFQVRRIPH